jgi:hypothetical protein
MRLTRATEMLNLKANPSTKFSKSTPIISSQLEETLLRLLKGLLTILALNTFQNLGH